MDSPLLIIGKAKYINKPFTRLDVKERVIFVLYISGFTQREIRSFLRTDINFVSASIKKGLREYPNEIKNVFTISVGRNKNENV